MTKQQLIEFLIHDIQNETRHMLFYLKSASTVVSVYAETLQKFLFEQAESEMKHVKEFTDVLIGLGGVPNNCFTETPTLFDPKAILLEAVRMEEEVVKNYVKRIEEALELNDADGKFVSLFYEDQLQDSRKDLDLLSRMLRG